MQQHAYNFLLMCTRHYQTITRNRSRLYIGGQTRGGRSNRFFHHENQAFPPSIIDNELLYFGKKASLLQCIEKNQTVQVLIEASDGLYGAAVVHMLNPGQSKTFADYAETIFLPYVHFQLQNVN